MKEQNNTSNKSSATGLGAFISLVISLIVTSCVLFLLPPTPVLDKLPDENFHFEIPAETVVKKKVFTQDFISLDDTIKPKTSTVALSQPKQHQTRQAPTFKPKFASSDLKGEALQKQLDEKLRNAQDLVDSEDSENILKAKTMLEEILKKDPNHNESLKELAMIYMYDLDNNQKAEEYMLRSYEIKPDQAVFAEVMQLSRQNGTIDSFAEKVTERARKNPDDETAASQAASIIGAQGNNQQSAEMHARNGERFGSSKEFQSAANQYERMGNRAEAREMYEKALEQALMDPKVSEGEKSFLRSRIKSLSGS